MQLKSSKFSLIEESSSIKQILFDSAKEHIIFIHEDKIVDLNNKCFEFFNTGKEKVVGKSIYSLLASHSKNRLYTINLLKNKIESLTKDACSIFNIDYTDEELNTVSLKVNVTRIDSNEITKSFILKFDENIEQATELESVSHILFSLFAEQISMPACLLEIDGRILKINSKFAEFTGFENTEIESKKLFSDLIYEIENEDSSETKKFNLINKQNRKTEIEIDSIVLDDSNKIILIKDISSENNLRLELIKAKNNVTRIKNIFFAQISHEIRTPLSAILSFANLIEDEIKDKIRPDLKTGFEVIKRGGDRIIRTINLILNMSEVMTESYKINPKNIDLFIESFHPLYQKYKKYSSDKCLEMNYSVKSENRIVNIDQYMIEQIFSNLLDNAVKYTDTGSIDIRFFSNDVGNLTFEIKDSGIGITKEFQKKIFEPFTQEFEGYDRKYDGNGLGLALANRYCDICNIDMEIESNKNSGTTIRLVFNDTLKDVKRKSSFISAGKH